MSTAIGPITPTTVTVWIDCQPDILVGPVDLSALGVNGYPSTYLCTNIGSEATLFNIGSEDYISSTDPNSGNLLMPGQSIVLKLAAPLSVNAADPLVGFSFCPGGTVGTAVSVTGIDNK
jgi:hypothetical protein